MLASGISVDVVYHATQAGQDAVLCRRRLAFCLLPLGGEGLGGPCKTQIG